MATPKPYRYWTNSLFDSSGGALPTPDPITNSMLPSRSSSDTLLRHLWTWSLAARFDVGLSGAPTPSWPYDATVFNDVIFDVDGSGPTGDIADDDQRRIGFDQLLLREYVIGQVTPGFQTVVWSTSVGILNLESGRMGAGGEVTPTVWSRLWPTDHLGVFVGAYGSHVKFQVYGYGRALWASDQPPP